MYITEICKYSKVLSLKRIYKFVLFGHDDLVLQFEE